MCLQVYGVRLDSCAVQYKLMYVLERCTGSHRKSEPEFKV
jgi:hypothetical protein